MKYRFDPTTEAIIIKWPYKGLSLPLRQLPPRYLTISRLLLQNPSVYHLKYALPLTKAYLSETTPRKSTLHFCTTWTKPLAPPKSSGRPPRHTKPSLNFIKYQSSSQPPVKSHSNNNNNKCPMTVAVLQMQGSRSSSISKPQKPGKPRKVRLPAIAPRYQLASDLDTFIKTDPTVKAGINLLRTRLPPRSRFGCWCAFLLHILS